jgi:hypothetical protein
MQLVPLQRGARLSSDNLHRRSASVVSLDQEVAAAAGGSIDVLKSGTLIFANNAFKRMMGSDKVGLLF